MNHQGVSEICFDEMYTVPESQTARHLFARLPHGSQFAQRMIEGLATSYLIAVVESICIREMQHHIDHDQETVVGVAVDIGHCAPAPVGAQLKICGWNERIGERDAAFRVSILDAHEVVAEGTLRLAVVRRARMESRMAWKMREPAIACAAGTVR